MTVFVSGYRATLAKYYAVFVCLSVCMSICPSVCLSQASTVPKRQNIESRKQRHTVAQKLFWRYMTAHLKVRSHCID